MSLNAVESQVCDTQREMVVGYARISVEKEDVTNQVKAIEEYCRKKGYHLLKVFTETITGVTSPLDRPEFKKMIEVCKALNIKKIIMYDVSRLGRNIKEVFQTLKFLRDNGIMAEFVAYPELQNLSPSAFDIFVFTFALAAQLEREFLLQRLKAARNAGKPVGPKPVELPVEIIRKLRKKGVSWKTIYWILREAGYLYHNWGGRKRPLSYEQFIRRVKLLQLRGEL